MHDISHRNQEALSYTDVPQRTTGFEVVVVMNIHCAVLGARDLYNLFRYSSPATATEDSTQTDVVSGTSIKN
jgi:hypothetical protein